MQVIQFFIKLHKEGKGTLFISCLVVRNSNTVEINPFLWEKYLKRPTKNNFLLKLCLRDILVRFENGEKCGSSNKLASVHIILAQFENNRTLVVINFLQSPQNLFSYSKVLTCRHFKMWHFEFSFQNLPFQRSAGKNLLFSKNNKNVLFSCKLEADLQYFSPFSNCKSVLFSMWPCAGLWISLACIQSLVKLAFFLYIVEFATKTTVELIGHIHQSIKKSSKNGVNIK